MQTFKVLICGSREFDNTEAVRQALIEVRQQHPDERLVIIHGDARGADTIGKNLGLAAVNASVVTVPAKWDVDGKGAGPIRNRVMLDLGPDLVLAFFKEGAGNRGTTDMVNASKQAGVEVRSYRS